MIQDIIHKIEKILFPRWEKDISTLGINNSHPGNKSGLRLALNEILASLRWQASRARATARALRDYGSLMTSLRLVVTLLLMVCGVSGVKADDIAEGMYFIKIGDIFVWRAISEKASGQPYLSGLKGTSYSDTDYTLGPAHCSWIIKPVTINEGGIDKTYYTFINVGTNQYVVWDHYTSGTAKAVHLETRATEPTQSSDHCFFKYELSEGKYYIHPDECNTANTGLNYKGEFYADDKLKERTTNPDRGLIQFYNGTANTISSANLLTAPTISDVNPEKNRVTVTDNNGLPAGYNIRYTFSSTGTPADPTATSSIMDANGYLVEQAGTLKVVIERYGVVLTGVAERAVSPVPCATPEISFDFATSKVSITCATTGASIYYTIDGYTPTTTSTPYSEPFVINGNTTVKAIAVCTDFPNSEVAELTINTVPSPSITYNTDNLIEMATDVEGASIYYTTDGTTPSVINGRRYQTPFDPADNVTTIKAVTIDKEGNVSSATTFTPPTLLGTNHIRLIQNQGNAWTCDEHPGGHFYMLPNSESNLSTTSLFLPDMQWYFLNAGIDEGDGYQYYYIIRDDKRLWSDGTKVQLKTFDSENANQFKFRLKAYPETGTPTDYNIVPYGLTTGNMYVNKPNGNGDAAVIALGSSNSDGTARWKFILLDAFDKTPPFTASNDNQSYFYQIASGVSYIIQSSETAVATSTSTDAEEVKKGSWMLMLVPDVDIPLGDSFTYYYIRNAKTNDYLYYNDGATPGFAISSTITEGQEDKYRFCWARSTATDTYYLIPRTQVSTAKSSLLSFSAYTITAAPGFILDPVLTMDEKGIVTMTCATNGSEIFYRIDGDYTETTEGTLTTATNPEVPAESGKRPTLPTRLYSTDFLLSLDATQVRAVAVLKNDRSVKSAVKIINLTQCGTPAPTDENFHDAQGSLTIPKVQVTAATEEKPAVYADIYYALDGNAPALVESTPHGEEPEIVFEYNTRSKIYAVAVKHGMRKSEPYEQEVVYMPTITLDQTSYTYSAKIENSAIVSQAIEPTITKVQVAGENTPIATGVYHVIEYKDNTEAGTGKIFIKATPEASIKLYGIGNFVIDKASISSVEVDKTSFTYNYRTQGPEITSILATTGIGNIELLNFDAYYTVTSNVHVSAGNYKLRVEAKDGTNFTGYQEVAFTIGAKSLTSDDISIVIKKVVNGNTVTYAPTIKDGSVTLKETKDYTVSTPVATQEGCQLTISGKDNYTGSVVYDFIELSFERPEKTNIDYAAPYVASADLATPLGMTAYIAIGTKGNKVILEALEYIPNGVPVLLLTGKHVDGFGKVTKTGDTYTEDELATINAKNKLKVKDSDWNLTEHAAIIYLFYKGEFVLNATGTLPAGKVYLDLRDTSTPSPAPRLTLSTENTTEVEDVRGKMEDKGDERWYTLDGRRLQGKPTQKGLYIRNGRKVVINR